VKNFKYLFLVFIFCFSAYADDFDFKEAYRINEIHDAGIKGNGYRVSILEHDADETHDALKGQIQIISPSSFTRDGHTEHGNHVSALLVGNRIRKEDDTLVGGFSGGVIPSAKGGVFPTGSINSLSPQDYADDSLPIIKMAAENGHVINQSGGLAHKSAYDKHLSQNFLKSLKATLEENDSLLVITASNDPAFIGRSRELSHLESLLSDPELMERVLIVANLEYVDEAGLEEQERSLKFAKENLAPLLQRFHDEVLEKEPAQKFSTSAIFNDLNKHLKEVQHEDLSFYNLPEIHGFFYTEFLDKFKNKLLMSKEEILEKVIRQKKGILEFGDSAFGGEDDDKVAAKIGKLIPMIKHILNQSPYIDQKEQYPNLVKFIKANSNDEEIMSILENNCQFFKYLGWCDNKEYIEEITRINNSLDIKLRKIPDDKHNTGIPISTLAGVAQDDFLLIYGKRILSAWGKNTYTLQTGSSMAAPILSGIVVLLHEYLNQGLHQPTSWKEVLHLIKSNARKIGDPEIFGLGVLDMEKLFDFDKLKYMGW